MSNYHHKYIREDCDCEVEVTIDYEVYGGGWEYPHPCTPAVRFWIPSNIELNGVSLNYVDYWNPEGDVIATVKGEDMQIDARKYLEGVLFEEVYCEIEDNSALSDELMENA